MAAWRPIWSRMPAHLRVELAGPEPPGRLGDVHHEVAAALELVDDPQRRQRASAGRRPSAAGGRGAGSTGPRSEWVRSSIVVVVRDDVLGAREVAVEQGLGAGRDGLGRERAEADHVDPQLVELLVEGLAGLGLGHRGSGHDVASVFCGGVGVAWSFGLIIVAPRGAGAPRGSAANPDVHASFTCRFLVSPVARLPPIPSRARRQHITGGNVRMNRRFLQWLVAPALVAGLATWSRPGYRRRGRERLARQEAASPRPSTAPARRSSTPSTRRRSQAFTHQPTQRDDQLRRRRLGQGPPGLRRPGRRLRRHRRRRTRSADLGQGQGRRRSSTSRPSSRPSRCRTT